MLNFDLGQSPIAEPKNAVTPGVPPVVQPITPVAPPVPIIAPTKKRAILTLEEISRGAKSALLPLFRRFSSLVVAFLIFSLLADYTAFTTGALHPGSLVFSNTMIQLWTATYRLAYVYMAVLTLFSIVAPTLWTLYKPDGNERFDLSTFIVNHLTETQQVWLFFVTFWLNCLFFILLLMVRLPESVSVGP